MRVPGHGEKGSRVKRPILGSLAAAVLSLGLLGASPVQAAGSRSLTAAAVAPAHDTGEDHGHKYSAHHSQGGTRHHDHDDDGHDHHRRRCSGLIVVCLV
jgi:hypothetical protein